MRDRLSAAARQRAPRPKAILVLYAALAFAAILIFVGQLAGWWPSSVANKVLQRRKEADAQKSPPDPAMSDSAPNGTR